jgi:hypothetical protein
MSLASRTRSTLRYQAVPTRGSHPDDDWTVEAIDHASEGEVYAARFMGHNAEARAHEYAEWKNCGGGCDWSQAQSTSASTSSMHV